MAKMRSLAPWFIISVGGLFVLFMVLSDSKITDIIGSRANNVGSINGEDITYQQFSNALEQYRQLQTQSTGEEIPESQLEAFRDQVWQAIVSQRILAVKIEELGLNVSDEEVRESLLGPNPPSSVQQYFLDSLGNFNRQAYEGAIYNPANKQAVVQLEDQVRQQLLQDKLKSQIEAAASVSEGEIKRKFVDQNIKMNAEYIVVEAGSIADSLVQVSDSDYEKYYEENKENYKVDEQRKYKYVLFKKEATRADTNAIRDNLAAILIKLQSDTSSFKTYVEIYSEQPYAQDTTQLSKIPAGAQDAIYASAKGQLIGPILTNNGFSVFRVVDVKSSKSKTVHASHILISQNPTDPNDNKEAMDIYKRLIAGENFATLAKEFSKDPGSGPFGGDLGWFGQGMMVKEFDEAAFKGKIGEIQKPVKSQFGWHIIKVIGISDKDYIVEKIFNKIQPSATTLDRIYENASDFAYLSDQNGFEESVSELNYSTIETDGFKEDVNAIPGLGSNKAMVKFAFENSVESVSPVFKVTAGYAVGMVSEKIKAGYQPLEEVKVNMQSQVLREKKNQKAFDMIKEIHSYLGGSAEFEKSKEIVPVAKTGAVQNFSPSGTIPRLGREFAFAQRAFELPLNTVSEPFKGSRGSFIIKVTSKTEFDETAYSLQKNTIRDNILRQKKSSLFNNWVLKLTEEADVVDNRHLFYR
ncbi:MAG: peptidylprolyl isomerase [Bacteroidota bacterium]